MSNQHAVSVTALSIPSTAEIVVMTMTPFSENNPVGAGGYALVGVPGVGGQGVVLDANLNITPSGAPTVTMRFRYTSLTGSLVVNSIATVTTLAAVASTVSAFALDTTLQEANAVYVVTAQISTGTATVNYGVFTAQDATTAE